MNTSNQTQQQQQQHKAKPAQATSKAGRGKRIAFELGEVVMTPAACGLLNTAGVTFVSLLARHARGDWGTGDKEANQLALVDGSRLLSIYHVGEEGSPVWLLTDAGRQQTTFLTPGDY